MCFFQQLHLLCGCTLRGGKHAALALFVHFLAAEEILWGFLPPSISSCMCAATAFAGYTLFKFCHLWLENNLVIGGIWFFKEFSKLPENCSPLNTSFLLVVSFILRALAYSTPRTIHIMAPVEQNCSAELAYLHWNNLSLFTGDMYFQLFPRSWQNTWSRVRCDASVESAPLFVAFCKLSLGMNHFFIPERALLKCSFLVVRCINLLFWM